MQTPTLIFDEVDVGIGGRTAAIVGDMLKTLGAQTQVFVVTHQPKSPPQAQHTCTSVREFRGPRPLQGVDIDGSERVEEIARMLGGISITESTLARERINFGLMIMSAANEALMIRIN